MSNLEFRSQLASGIEAEVMVGCPMMEVFFVQIPTIDFQLIFVVGVIVGYSKVEFDDSYVISLETGKIWQLF